MKKICFITTIQLTMETFVVPFAKALAEKGYEVTYICNMDDAFIEKNCDYAKCIDLPMRRGFRFFDIMKFISKLKKIFRKEKYDAIYYATDNASFYASIAGKAVGVPIRIYAQWGIHYVSAGGVTRMIMKFLEKTTCSRSTHIRAQSPLNRQFAVDEKLCPEDKIKVLGIGGTIGVDISFCDSIDRKAENAEIRKRYGIEENDFVFGYVGRVNVDKGCSELINAFRSVREKHDNVRLLLVGPMDDINGFGKEEFEKIKSDGSIVSVGKVSANDVYRYMASIDVLVHPTYREGFGKVLQEAMGMCLPIITTDVPGPKEVVEDGVSGILVPVKNEKALAEEMTRLYEDEVLRKSLSIAGRSRAEKYFDRPIMIGNILNDIDDIVG